MFELREVIILMSLSFTAGVILMGLIWGAFILSGINKYLKH